VTAVSGQARLQSLAERHVEEAAVQRGNHLFLQLVTMESNSDFKKKYDFRLRRTYSL
jgi:hypothetical protein